MTADFNFPYLPLDSPDFSTRSTSVNDAREANWCARTPYGLAVLRHREAGELLRDRRVRQGSHSWPDANGLEGSFADFWKRSVIGKEGAEHQAIRKLAGSALSPDFVASLAPEFEAIADGLIAGLLRNCRCEFMADFANPFASMAICRLLGIDTADWRRIGEDASALGLAMGVNCRMHQSAFNAACDRLEALSRRLIEGAVRSRVGHGNGNEFVTRIVSRADDFPDIDEQALVDLVLITIFGGVDTTRSQLGNAIALFIDHPDQWNRLRRQPELIPVAIEEVIREHPTTTWVTRQALEDFPFRGQTIHEGETLHLLVHATARDPVVCENPAFDISADRKMHFGFGAGAHHCLGHRVARTDMACAISAISRNVSKISSAGWPEWLPDSGNTGPVCLPVKFT
ncbi:MAG: cytochrome P450 [Paracoccaceae bacterium]|nr:cytochrome P450 [Paracoccaceae bacterium]